MTAAAGAAAGGGVGAVVSSSDGCGSSFDALRNDPDANVDARGPVGAGGGKRDEADRKPDGPASWEVDIWEREQGSDTRRAM